MPPSTEHLSRTPRVTRTNMTAVAVVLQAVAPVVPEPWGYVLTALAWLLAGGAHIPQPGQR